jgi:hypothetical protein
MCGISELGSTVNMMPEISELIIFWTTTANFTWSARSPW